MSITKSFRFTMRGVNRTSARFRRAGMGVAKVQKSRFGYIVTARRSPGMGKFHNAIAARVARSHATGTSRSFYKASAAGRSFYKGVATIASRATHPFYGNQYVKLASAGRSLFRASRNVRPGFLLSLARRAR